MSIHLLCFIHIDPLEGTETSGLIAALDLNDASSTSTRLRVLKQLQRLDADAHLAASSTSTRLRVLKRSDDGVRIAFTESFIHIDPLEGTETPNAHLAVIIESGFIHIDPLEGTETFISYA